MIVAMHRFELVLLAASAFPSGSEMWVQREGERITAFVSEAAVDDLKRSRVMRDCLRAVAEFEAEGHPSGGGHVDLQQAAKAV